MSEESKKISVSHQKWILQTLKDNDGSCTYEKIVEIGELHHCDTVGAMLKILKGKKAIDYNQIFLMYPTHKNEVVTLKNADYDPEKN
jgi:hypothetical protein